MIKIVGLALACFIGLMGVASAESVQPKVGQAYGDWVFQCTALAEGKTACAFLQKVVMADGKTQILQLQIAKAATGTGNVLTVVMPLGLDIAAGASADVDGAAPFPLPLRTCLPRGCIGSVEVDASLAALLRSGAKLNVKFTLAAGKKEIDTAGSLVGLSKALDASGWF